MDVNEVGYYWERSLVNMLDDRSMEGSNSVLI